MKGLSALQGGRFGGVGGRHGVCVLLLVVGVMMMMMFGWCSGGRVDDRRRRARECSRHIYFSFSFIPLQVKEQREHSRHKCAKKDTARTFPPYAFSAQHAAEQQPAAAASNQQQQQYNNNLHTNTIVIVVEP